MDSYNDSRSCLVKKKLIIEGVPKKGALSSHHDLDVAEASVIRAEASFELVELGAGGGDAQLAVREQERCPAIPSD